MENLNSRLQNYFFLRKRLGLSYLNLLQFFLNYRQFMKSEDEERVGKSPRELMTGESHPHWLEMLGFKRFQTSLKKNEDGIQIVIEMMAQLVLRCYPKPLCF